MVYELYTAPKCPDCIKTKGFLDERKVNYKRIDLIDLYQDREAKKTYGRVMIDIGKQLRRTVEGKAMLPLLVKRDGNGGIEVFAQKYDEISKLFG